MQLFEQQLQQLKQANQIRQIPPLVHDGAFIYKENQKMLNLSGNDYLGLSYKRDLQQEFLALHSDNLPLFSSTSSRLLTGNSPEYQHLEESMALAFDRESCLLFNTGYHANIGIIPALSDENTLIISDQLIHASLIDGIRLSKATRLRFAHNDYEQLQQLLEENHQHYPLILIVTESVFSMDGDHADLTQLVNIKKQYPNTLLYVDEAHAIGVYGQNGLGLAEEQGCIADIDLLVGTFGKAMASVGAYLISSQLIRDTLINKMRPLIFSTALPPLNIAWTHFIFNKLPKLQAQRQHLAHISAYLRTVFAEQFHLPMPSQSCIVPYIVGDNQKAIALAYALQQQGYYCLPIRPPTVPKGTARIRFSLNADMQQDTLDLLIHVLKGLNNA